MDERRGPWQRCAVAGLLFAVWFAATHTVYDTTALLLVARPRIAFELESRVRSGDALPTGPATVPVFAERLKTIAMLTMGPDIEAAVQARLGDRLPAEQRR